jgi:hypothetical protein
MSNATRPIVLREFVTYRGVRCVGARIASAWSSARRQQYLLREGVELPWSFDVRVLPEASKSDLAADLREVVATVLDLGPGSGADEWEGSSRFEDLPQQPAWRPLGYDICDAIGISGIANCGYDAETLHTLRQAWAEAFNEYHLLSTIESALTYRAFTDARVSEHAPFAVLRIWTRTGSV